MSLLLFPFLVLLFVSRVSGHYGSNCMSEAITDVMILILDRDIDCLLVFVYLFPVVFICLFGHDLVFLTANV